jgi:hypothetical protein
MAFRKMRPLIICDGVARSVIDARNTPAVAGCTGGIQEIGTQRAGHAEAVQDFFATSLHTNQSNRVGAAIAIASAATHTTHSTCVTQAKSAAWASAVAAGGIAKQGRVVAHQLGLLDAARDISAQSICIPIRCLAAAGRCYQ